MNNSEKTVVDLIESLNKKGVSYSVARNYDDFPRVENDLDLFLRDGVEVFREVAIECAELNEWDFLLESRRWQSSVGENNIHVFVFISLKDNSRLQIDLFGGFSIFGAPLINSDRINDLSLFNEKLQINTAGCAVEGIIHVFQISAHLNNESKRSKIKVQDYKDKILKSTDLDCVRKIIKLSEELGLVGFENVLICLKHEKYSQFKFRVGVMKVCFLIRSLLIRPYITFKSIVERVRYYINCVMRPYYMVININATNFDIKNINQEIEALEISHVVIKAVLITRIIDWIIKLKDVLRVVERGGLIVCIKNGYDFYSCSLSDIVKGKILSRDELLWTRM